MGLIRVFYEALAGGIELAVHVVGALAGVLAVVGALFLLGSLLIWAMQ